MADVSRSELGDLERRRIGGNFFSRKNTVFKSVFLGRIVIVKVYGAGRSSLGRKEFSVLRECHEKGVLVPKPIELREDAVLMEFVEGITLADSLDTYWLDGAAGGPDEKPRIESTARSVGGWLATFHSAFGNGMSRGDSNARNFLVSGDEVFGVDFEESSQSDVLDDVGQMCSSVLSMHPMFTQEKFDFCHELARSYFSAAGQDRSSELGRATAKALRYYASYRSDANAMLEMASEMERTGLLQAGSKDGRSGHRST
jgi:tRNA A-37 threonylcarbamoyl transferase component Bud32